MSGHRPNIHNLDSQENIACQNIQARSRMVLSYMCAQMLPSVEKPDRKWPGTLLVLGSANLDEAYRGYYTKYDCSSADLNPIGGVGKLLLRRFLHWAGTQRGLSTLLRIVDALPSAELQPTGDDGKQNQVSEDEMGMTYEEIETFGKLRVAKKCGPVSMFHKLRDLWKALPGSVIADKVKRFFRYYAINRHKVTSLPPALHVESSGCDDNRYDLRQFLYNVAWSRQFKAIDEAVDMEDSSRQSSRQCSPSSLMTLAHTQ
jgi:NAD+ synthase (glutamine-hydrolysing)